MPSNALAVAAELIAIGGKAKVATQAVTRHYGQLMDAQVKANASGRPGPRVITGQYRAEINTVYYFEGADFVSSTGTNHPAGRRLEGGFVGRDSLGRSYCVDDQTEALTQRGWMSHDQLLNEDLVLTLNPSTWTSEWQQPSAINRFPYDGDLILIDGRTMSAATTPEHRWLIEKYYGRGRCWITDWRTTADMVPNARVPLVTKCSDLPHRAQIDDDIVELAGWFWTEGSYAYGAHHKDKARPIALRLSQSPVANSSKVERIRRLLTRIFGPEGRFTDGAHWHEYPNKHTGTISFSIDRVGAWLLERHIAMPHKALRPEFLMQLTQPQLELLIEVSFLADGHVQPGGTAVLTQASEERIRSFEMACVLAGRSIVTRHRFHHGFEFWGTTLLQSSWSHAFGSALRTDRNFSRVETMPYDGIVWCPTTSNGTWLARRNGTVYFTGNSQPPYAHFGPAADKIGPQYVDAIQKAIRL